MKHLSLFVLLTLSVQAVLSQSPSFAWANSIGGVGDEFANDLTTDAFGNVYITGAFSGAVDFDPGPDVYTQYSVLLRDAFVAKYNANGEFVWAKTLGGNYHDSGSCIITDEDGNVYVGGGFVNTVDFDPGPEVFNLTSAGTMNTPDMFLLKLDADGNFISAFNLGSTGYDSARDLALDTQGNLYIAGLFYETVNFGLVDETPVNLTSNGNNDIYVCKFNPSLQLMWAKSFGSIASDSESALSLVVDADGNAFTCGSFPFSVDFDPGDDEFNITSTGNEISSDVFLHKLDSNGNFVWVKTIGSVGPDTGYALDLDADENILITGLFTNMVDFDPSDEVHNLSTSSYWTPYVLKLDSEGNYDWAKAFLGTDAGIGQSIDTDIEGNVYTTGFFRGIHDFNPSGNEYFLSAQESEVYISKLSSGGDFIYAKALGGPSYDAGEAIAVDAENNVITLGSFEEEGNFNSDTLQVTQLPCNGFADVFIHKMGDDTDAITEIHSNQNSMVVYPNPTHHHLGVLLPRAMDILSLEIINQLGQVCATKYSVLSKENIDVDLSALKPGVYFLKVTSQTGYQETIEIVKE